MDKKEFICISCPVGCLLKVEIKNEEIFVKGNECKRGEIYAKKECINPRRIVTTSIKTFIDNEIRLVSVKTSSDIPKDKIYDCISTIKEFSNKNQKSGKIYHVGDIVIKNIFGIDVDILATSSNF